MTPAELYAARIDAVRAQRARLHGTPPLDDPWGGSVAQRFRYDPHRPLDPNLTVLASHLRPDDVLVDVGGGAGRVALPLALRCREVLTVDASPGMGEVFAAAAAGISNARFLHANWLEAEGVQGDVTLTSNVTYFVREIDNFLDKLATAACRRVMITVWSVANPNQSAALFHLVYGEEPWPCPAIVSCCRCCGTWVSSPMCRCCRASPWCREGLWGPGYRRRRRTPCGRRCKGSGWGRTTRRGRVS